MDDDLPPLPFLPDIMTSPEPRTLKTRAATPDRSQLDYFPSPSQVEFCPKFVFLNE